MIIKTIVQTYTDYVLAYDKYVDKCYTDKFSLMVNEENALDEIELCDSIYQSLDIFVRAISQDEEMHYDLMNILSVTNDQHKISMAENLKNFFDYIG